MKKIFQSILIMVLFSTICALSACKKMDSTYEKFIVPGGITYAGKATLPKVYAGQNRVLITWHRGSDPNVTSAKVFWNNYLDSVNVAIPAAADSISVFINNLEEQTYTFIIMTYDAKGNTSIPVEVLGSSYGSKYQATLLNRAINASELDPLNNLTINWGNPNITGGYFGTEVRYTDLSGNTRVQRYTGVESTSFIPDRKMGTTYDYRTIYIPNITSIDTFYTSYETKSLFYLTKAQWTVKAFSTQNSGAANLAINVIDGNPATRWHTDAKTSKYPHFVTVDMGIENTITTFEIYRTTGDDRACDTFQLLVSVDNITWTNLGNFDFNRLSDSGQLYDIPSRPKARYFKFVGLSGSLAYMVTGEINVYSI